MFLSARVAGGEARRGGAWAAAQEQIYLGPYGVAILEPADCSVGVLGYPPTSPPPRPALAPST